MNYLIITAYADAEQSMLLPPEDDRFPHDELWVYRKNEDGMWQALDRDVRGEWSDVGEGQLLVIDERMEPRVEDVDTATFDSDEQSYQVMDCTYYERESKRVTSLVTVNMKDNLEAMKAKRAELEAELRAAGVDVDKLLAGLN